MAKFLAKFGAKFLLKFREVFGLVCLFCGTFRAKKLH